MDAHTHQSNNGTISDQIRDWCSQGRRERQTDRWTRRSLGVTRCHTPTGVEDRQGRILESKKTGEVRNEKADENEEDM